MTEYLEITFRGATSTLNCVRVTDLPELRNYVLEKDFEFCLADLGMHPERREVFWGVVSAFPGGREFAAKFTKVAGTLPPINGNGYGDWLTDVFEHHHRIAIVIPNAEWIVENHFNTLVYMFSEVVSEAERLRILSPNTTRVIVHFLLTGDGPNFEEKLQPL